MIFYHLPSNYRVILQVGYAWVGSNSSQRQVNVRRRSRYGLEWFSIGWVIYRTPKTNQQLFWSANVFLWYHGQWYGKRAVFNRDKLANSILTALRKRKVDSERVEKLISGIVRRVESLGESEVDSSVIGGIVMEGLQSIDSVAYVRFASVYKNFREVKDFEDFLGNLEDK